MADDLEACRGPAAGRVEVLGATIEARGRTLRLDWSDGFSEALPAAWFCDNADGAFDANTGQRTHSPADLQSEALIESARLEPGGLMLRALPGGVLRLSRGRLGARRRVLETHALWRDAGELGDIAPIRAEAFLTQDTALAEALGRLVRLGLAVLSGAGTTPGRVADLVARFGFIRQTNYGRLFDVRAEPAAIHLAYTNRALDLHTDNPYREPVPTLQVLHAIRASQVGGETSFVDGFAHVAAMAVEDLDGLALLAGEPVEFRHLDPDGGVYAARRPVIELEADGATRAVNLNHRSLAPLTMAAEKLTPWYSAYGAFCRRIHRPGVALAVIWRPGDVVLFDNRRILHGRGAFAAREGGGDRWLQGCYAEMDGARATLARLSARASRA